MGVEDTVGRVGCGCIGCGLSGVDVPELIGGVISATSKDRGAIVVDGGGRLVECGCATGVTELANGEEVIVDVGK